jgi:hypothetical protein
VGLLQAVLGPALTVFSLLLLLNMGNPKVIESAFEAVPLTGFAMMAFFAGIYGFVSGMMGIAGGIGYLRKKWKPLRTWAASLQIINAPLGTALLLASLVAIF